MKVAFRVFPQIFQARNGCTPSRSTPVPPVPGVTRSARLMRATRIARRFALARIAHMTREIPVTPVTGGTGQYLQGMQPFRAPHPQKNTRNSPCQHAFTASTSGSSKPGASPSTALANAAASLHRVTSLQPATSGNARPTRLRRPMSPRFDSATSKGLNRPTERASHPSTTDHL